MWNRDFPVSPVLLCWLPRCDWSLWPRLMRALSWTVTRPSWRQCDNPTWSQTALLSRFHACCWSSFLLHNRHSRLLGGSLWRACALTAFTHSSLVQWSTCLLPVIRDPGSIPRGVMWNRDSPVNVVSLQFSISLLFKVNISVTKRIADCWNERRSITLSGQSHIILPKPLIMVFCSSRDGIPFKINIIKLPGLQFSSTDRFSLLLFPLRIRWTIPLVVVGIKVKPVIYPFLDQLC
jgi:hypothetical protein